ncbi:MAG: MFS transporter [Planctomycetota bacterium]|jgi:MFS family permease
MSTKHEEHSTSFRDVKQLGLFAAIASLGYVFWVVGGMEMIERLAFYGVKAVATLYAKEPASEGGLGVNLAKFGTLLMVWAFVQSFLPIFTGGLSDRYGYKLTIFLSTVLKIIGYLLMAWFPTYWGFFAGAVVLATGTAIFKPGIQGTLVRSTTRRNSSMAWGIFYQTVNIGGWIGPLMAGALRVMEWEYVFYSCAGIISINFLLLLTYKEVGKEERLERNRLAREGLLERPNLARESIRELIKPHVWTYLLLFSGFWFMFMALFDVLPAHIDDWVDTTDIVRTLFPGGPPDNWLIKKVVVMNPEGTVVLPEGMVNVNALIIMLTCFLFAYFSGLMRATTSIVVGTLFASAAMFACGQVTLGWMSIGAISIFSVGEMLSSPKFSEFIGNFAPHDKKAMYLGFSQIPIAIGWTLEGKLGLTLYDRLASKDRFSRELLLERINAGQAALPPDEQVQTFAENADTSVEAITCLYDADPQWLMEKIPQGEAFDWLLAFTGENAKVLSDLMYTDHNVGFVWYVLGGIGILSAIGIWIYGRWILTLKTAD